MEGHAGIGAAAGLLAALAAGCCGLQGRGTSAIQNRDTPEAAFGFVRAAFMEDRTRDQYQSFHPDFVERQGLSESKYSLARTLSPGTFRRGARILETAAVAGIERGDGLPTTKGPRPFARVTLRTGEGQGVFLLVDDPIWILVTDDGELGPISGPAGDLDGAVRVEGDRLSVRVQAGLDFAPKPGSKVLRFEIHHDWLLYGIESLDGFEEFLDEVKDTAAKAATEEKPR